MAPRRKRFVGRRRRSSRGKRRSVRGVRRRFTRRPKGYRSRRQVAMSRRIIEASHPKQYFNCLILGDTNATPVLSMVTSQPYCINVTDCIYNAAVQMLSTQGGGFLIDSGINATRIFVDKVTVELFVTNLVPTATYFNANGLKFCVRSFWNPFFNQHYSINDPSGNKRCQWQALSPLTTANDFPTSALWWGTQANHGGGGQSTGDFLYFYDAPINPTTMLFERHKKRYIKPTPMQGVSGGVAQNTSSSGTELTMKTVFRPRRVYEFQTSYNQDQAPGNDPLVRLANPMHNSHYMMIHVDDFTLAPGSQQNACTLRSSIRVQGRLVR